MSTLILRPLVGDDRDSFVAGHRAMVADDFEFGLRFDEREAWPNYVTRLETVRRGEVVPDGWVPSTFLVADVGGEIVGRISIRHELNDYLAQFGGHIGYGVLTEHRRCGYATEMLRQGLTIARSYGIGPVLLTCYDDNVGSATVIERCGGVFESVVERDSRTRLRRYWIPR